MNDQGCAMGILIVGLMWVLIFVGAAVVIAILARIT
jgi:hypothetical protein